MNVLSAYLLLNCVNIKFEEKNFTAFVIKKWILLVTSYLMTCRISFRLITIKRTITKYLLLCISIYIRERYACIGISTYK